MRNSLMHRAIAATGVALLACAGSLAPAGPEAHDGEAEDGAAQPEDAAVSTDAVVLGDGSPGSSFPAGVDPSKTLVSLSPSEIGALCDWGAREQGGYGTMTLCEATGVPLEVANDQAECVAELSPNFGRATCTTTVGQWVYCIEWLVANWCSAEPAARPPICDDFQTRCYGPPPDAGPN